jgi:hypothetical protein
MDAAAKAVKALQDGHPGLQKVAVKLNLGSSGEGNLYPSIGEWKGVTHAQRLQGVKEALEAAKVGIPDENGHVDTFADILRSEGAAIEQFIPGIERASFPSVQWEIRPDGTVVIHSSHEQILVDRNNYVGATLSADGAYRKVLERMAFEVATELAKNGVVGRGGTDFAAIKQSDGGYDVYLIENNIRMTGTTHPLLAAAGLTGATYKKGALRLGKAKAGGQAPIRYKAVDHDVRPNLVGLDVDGFLTHFERPENRSILFDPQKRSGVLFHLLPAVKAGGNVGYTIIADSLNAVQAIQKRLTEILNGLELEYLSGKASHGVEPLYVSADVRLSVEERVGHARAVKIFQAYLARYPDDLYSREKGYGIVFHPAGYTVIGRDKAEVMNLQAKAEALLRGFDEMVPAPPSASR